MRLWLAASLALAMAFSSLSVRAAEDEPKLSPMHQTVVDGAADRVRTLIAQGVSVEERGQKNVTPLMMAAQGGRVDVMKVLLEAGADPKATRDNDVTALHHAVAAHGDEAARLLIAAGGVIDARTASGLTPLQAAVAAHNWDAVGVLLAAGADPLAASKGNLMLVTALSVHKSSDEDLWPPLDVELARRLVAKGVVLDARDEKNRSLVHLAARLHNAPLVLYLVEQGLKADEADADGVTPLLAAASPASIEALIEGFPLLTAMSDVSGVDGRGLKRRLRTVGSPVLTGKDIAGRLQALMTARRGTVEALLAAGADPAAATPKGDTALKYAALNDDAGTVEALVKGGADPNVVLGNGLTPLQAAAQAANLDAVSALLANGAEVDLRNAKGETALMRAAVGGGDSQTVGLLLAAGAAVNAANNDGETPLMYAVGAGEGFLTLLYKTNPEMAPVVERLLAAGADPTLKNTAGKTAAKLAGAKPKYKSAQKLLR